MATANFTFTTLTGTETAGWNSINSLITSIDTQLNTSNRLIYMSGWSAVAGQTIKWDAANSRWVPGTLDAAAFANNSVELGTKTTGDYVASIAAAGTNEVSVTGSGEGAAATVRLANNTALRGAATVETPPTYSGGSTGTVGRVPDAKYVTDALAYATSGNVTLGGDVTGNASANTIANNAITQAKMADNSVGTAEIIDDSVTSDKLRDDASVDANRAVTTNHVRNAAITSVKLADNVITADKIDVTVGGQLGLNQTGNTRRVTASYAPETTTNSTTYVLTGLTNVTIATPGEGVVRGILTAELKNSGVSNYTFLRVEPLNNTTPVFLHGVSSSYNVSLSEYQITDSSNYTLVGGTTYKKASMLFEYVPVFYGSGTNSVFNVSFLTIDSTTTAFVKNIKLSLIWTPF